MYLFYIFSTTSTAFKGWWYAFIIGQDFIIKVTYPLGLIVWNSFFKETWHIKTNNKRHDKTVLLVLWYPVN